MNSNKVKPEKFDHPHLVYHFTVPLIISCFIYNHLNIEKERYMKPGKLRPTAEKYSEPCQTSKMECFAKTVSDLQSAPS